MLKKYFNPSQTKGNLPHTFSFIQVEKQTFSVADFTILIRFEPFQIKLYPKILFKELILLSLSYFVSIKKLPIDAQIVVKDVENLHIASTKKKDIYMNIGNVRNNMAKVYYHGSFNHFYVVLNEILCYLLSKNDGFILHASSVQIDNKVAVFVAPSGTGKSTIMNMLSTVGKPLGDDSIIIRKYKGRHYVYQTPYIEKEGWIEKDSTRYPLSTIYFLKQGNKIQSKTLSKEQIVEKMLQLVPEFMQRHPDMIKIMLQFIQTSPDNLFHELTFSLDKEKVIAYFKGDGL